MIQLKICWDDTSSAHWLEALLIHENGTKYDKNNQFAVAAG